MSRTSFVKGVPIALLVAVMVLFSAFEVCTAQTAEFVLSDVKASVNRLFEVTLSAKGECSLSAFVAELLYDPEVLSFDSASVLCDDAQYSINSLEKGKLTAVYLDEKGTSCTEDTALISFKFKALAVGNTYIQLFVRDAITSLSEDIAVFECTGSNVAILSNATTEKSSSKASSIDVSASEPFASDEESDSLIKGTTYIGGVPVSNQTIVALVLSFLCTLCVAVYIAYKVGMHRQKEKQKPAPLIYKDKAGNDELSD